METWDGYLEDGTLAGVDLVRGEPVPVGLYHLVSDVLVRHTDGDYLLMRRDFCKSNFGGMYETTCGGSALKGEDPLACALRELREETGILAGRLVKIGQSRSHNTIYHAFLCVTDWDKGAIALQPGETIGYKWLGEAEFAVFIRSEGMIPVLLDRYRDYFTRMGYL